MNIVKIESRADSGGQIEFCLEPGPERGPALRTYEARLFESVVTVPTHGDSLSKCVSDCSLKIRSGQITSAIVRTKFGSSTKRSAQARVKGVIDAAEREV